MDLPSIRRKLHQLAETAGEEQKTAAYVEKVLEDIGIHAIERGLGGTGLIGWLDSGNPGPVVLFRAELDALPIEEKNSLEYASQTNGVAHKCGHDGHMAVLLGFANRVARQTLKKGKAGFLFQPAEETGEGAAHMLEDKAFPSLKPDHVFAFHNLPGYPKGHILTTNGVFCAGSKGLIVRLSGSTSHA
ncbi:amidohydrolase, partial [Balneolaceae bacterium ANBcel3]|nr:amidohydrolase [Balneolaceae bacterium ANBcel3]